MNQNNGMDCSRFWRGIVGKRGLVQCADAGRKGQTQDRIVIQSSHQYRKGNHERERQQAVPHNVLPIYRGR